MIFTKLSVKVKFKKKVKDKILCGIPNHAWVLRTEPETIGYYRYIERAIVCVFDVNGECLEVNRDYKYLIYSGVNATTLSASTDSNSLLKSHTVL